MDIEFDHSFNNELECMFFLCKQDQTKFTNYKNKICVLALPNASSQQWRLLPPNTNRPPGMSPLIPKNLNNYQRKSLKMSNRFDSNKNETMSLEIKVPNERNRNRNQRKPYYRLKKRIKINVVSQFLFYFFISEIIIITDSVYKIAFKMQKSPLHN